MKKTLIQLCLILAFLLFLWDDGTLPEETNNQFIVVTGISENIVSTTEEKQKTISDMEIITREGHPKFGDEEELARVIWGDIPADKVLFADSYAKYKNTNIITMDSFDGKLNSIEIYFQNFNVFPMLSVDEVLPVIASYIPLEQMKGLYEICDRFIAVPKEGEKGDTHYFIWYVKTDAEKENHPELFYDVVVEIQVSDGLVQMFRVFDDLPNWTRRLEFNGYAEQEWNYDFLSQ